MTEITPELKPEESFMDIMQELINDASLDYIEINYYNTGGCYVTANKGADRIKSYEFYKPANKSNRLSGEIGYLESHNDNIEVARSNSYARDTYKITKKSIPASDANVEKNYFEEKYISLNQGTSERFDNILEVLEHELSQPQVTRIRFEKDSDGNRQMLVEAGEKDGPGAYSESSIKLNSKNYDEAVRFIVRNSEFLGKKYSIGFVSQLCSEVEKTPISIYRKTGYMMAPISQKVPVSRSSVLSSVEGYAVMGVNGIAEFIEYQMDNDDTELIYLEKMEATRVEKAVITLKSGAKVEFFINDGDLALAEEYSTENKLSIEAEGFWTLSQTQKGSGNRRMLKIRRLETYRIEKNGSKSITNPKQFILDALKNPMIYKASFSPASQGLEGRAFIVHSNLPMRDEVYSSDINEIVGAEISRQIEENKRELEKKYNAVIRAHENGYISFHKHVRMDYKFLMKHNTFTEDMFRFLESAYRAGCNIVVQGTTGSGKTTLVRALYEGANDGQVTALLDETNELLFSESADNFISLRGSNANIADTALKINPSRLIVDSAIEPFGPAFMKECVKKNIQMVNSRYGSITMLNNEPDFVVPFDIEVEVSRGKIKQISQVTISADNEARLTPLWIRDDNGFTKVADPSRNLRRKIEAGLTKAPKGSETVTDSSVEKNANNPLVTISADEKEELMQAMETIKKFLARF